METIIETGVTVFPGGVCNRRGRWWIASMDRADPSSPARVLVRTAPTLHGPYSDPVVVATGCFDPGVAPLASGKMAVVYTADRPGAGGIYGKVAPIDTSGDPCFGDEFAVVPRTKGLGVHEVTLALIDHQAWMTYGQEPHAGSEIQSVIVRPLATTMAPGAPFTLATDSGAGPGGFNMRSTLTLIVGGMAIAYHRAVDPTVPRVICWATFDRGAAIWSPPVVAATIPGVDCYNGFAIRLATDEYRIYFTTYDGSGRSLAFVETFDRGLTWSVPVTIPTVPSARPVVAMDASGLVCLASDSGASELVAFDL